MAPPRPTPTYETLQLQVGPVAEICISRPKALNALNAQVLHELAAALTFLQEEPNLRCLIVHGAGDRAFVAGADIAAMSQMDAVQGAAFAKLGQQVFMQLELFAAPVLAAVQGFALGGGCELALACDAVYATTDAKFGQPEVKLGLLPGFGGTVRLPYKIGPGAAAEWIFTGDIYSASQAHALGLVQALVADGELLPFVRQKAQVIASRSPHAVRAAKQLLIARANTQAGMAFERVSFAHLFASGDTREGTAAFMQKREPHFAEV
jgi:enoyl-CoA hydratase